MAILATDSGSGGDFKQVPSGNHIGVCSMVVDLGKQRITSQQYGESIKHQVYIAWELPGEEIEWTDKDGNQQKGPMRIGRSYTLSLHENAALRADLESWRGRAFTEQERRGFDIVNLAGAPAMVNVTHKEGGGKTYANVTAVTPLPKGMAKPVLFAPALIYDNDHLSAFESLPEWLQKKVRDQVIDQQSPNNNASGFPDDLDDDVPF